MENQHFLNDLLRFLSDYSELGMILCFDAGLLIIVLLLIKMREDQKLIKATVAALVAFITTGRQIESKAKSKSDVEVLPKKKRGRPRKEK